MHSGLFAATQLFAALLFISVFLAPTAAWCLIAFIGPAVFANFYLAPVLAQTQGLVDLRMRGVASAIMLLIVNLIGLGLGPLMVGWLSDALTYAYGPDALRWALMSAALTILPWAAVHYYLAGSTIDADLERAQEGSGARALSAK